LMASTNKRNSTSAEKKRGNNEKFIIEGLGVREAKQSVHLRFRAGEFTFIRKKKIAANSSNTECLHKR